MTAPTNCRISEKAVIRGPLRQGYRSFAIPRQTAEACQWPAHVNSSRSPLASFRSTVSKPSVNQP
jgi:hypothetical protein